MIYRALAKTSKTISLYMEHFHSRRDQISMSGGITLWTNFGHLLTVSSGWFSVLVLCLLTCDFPVRINVFYFYADTVRQGGEAAAFVRSGDLKLFDSDKYLIKDGTSGPNAPDIELIFFPVGFNPSGIGKSAPVPSMNILAILLKYYILVFFNQYVDKALLCLDHRAADKWHSGQQILLTLLLSTLGM